MWPELAMTSMKIAALKDSLSATLRRVEGGEEIVVTDRDRPIVVMRAVEDADGITVIPARRPFAPIRDKRVAATKRRVDSLRALLAERGTR